MIKPIPNLVPSISIYFLQEYPINILIPFRGSGLAEDVDGWDLNAAYAQLSSETSVSHVP